jgi:hypothetical protein
MENFPIIPVRRQRLIYREYMQFANFADMKRISAAYRNVKSGVKPVKGGRP